MDDWLIIFIRMKVGSESWEANDSALTWREARDLSIWLDEVARDDPRNEFGSSIGFLEPVLQFETFRRTKDSIVLQVYCQKFPRPAPGEHFYKMLQFSRDQLKKAAEELGSELQRFPSRFPIDESEDDDDEDD